MNRLRKVLKKQAGSKNIKEIASLFEEAGKALSKASSVWENLSEEEENEITEIYQDAGIEMSLDDLYKALYKVSEKVDGE